VSFSCTEVPVELVPLTGKETGIDVGLKVFLVTAEGEPVDNPRYARKAERELTKAQRCVSRRKKGSKRRRKAVHQCAKKHQKVKRQRSDFHHKTALALVREYDTIYLEDLQIRTLSRRPQPKPDENGGHLYKGASRKAGLNKFVQDAAWYQFQSFVSCSNVAISSPRFPGVCLTVPSAAATRGSAWRRQDVLGATALCTLTTETVRRVPLAQRSQRGKSFALSQSFCA
jgi:hypothetical protein